jgi:hypothetical protein
LPGRVVPCESRAYRRIGRRQHVDGVGGASICAPGEPPEVSH